MSQKPPDNPDSLQRLLLLRNLSVAGQAATILLVHFGLNMTLPLGANLALLALLLLGNLPARWCSKKAYPGDGFVTGLLGFDVLALTALLYLNGGYTNPFAFLYLLPLAVAATLLPARQIWGLTLLSITGYTGVMAHYHPLPAYSGRLGDDFHLHLVGMWVSFVIGAGVIAFFVGAMADSNRKRQRLLAQARERELIHEKAVALGALAAGTTHELATPLSTMAVVITDLMNDLRGGDTTHDNSYRDLCILAEQITRCKEILDNNLNLSGNPRALHARKIHLNTFLDELVDRWREQQPETGLRVEYCGPSPSPELILDQTFRLTLINLLNNAAEARATEICCTVDWSAAAIRVAIADNGTGIKDKTANLVGTPYISDKGDGRGLGLFLTRSLVERLGGSFRIRPNGEGTLAEIILPRHALSP